MSDIDALNEFDTHVDELQEEYGIELSAEERRVLCGQSIQAGFTPESTVEAFGELVNEDSFDDDEESDEPETGTDRLIRHVGADVERLEAQYGRPLTGREKEIIAAGAVEQAERYDQVDSEGALDEHYAATRETRPDTNTSAGRQEFYRQRMHDKEEPAEIDPDRELDLNDQSDRVEFMQARLNGAEFEAAE